MEEPFRYRERPEDFIVEEIPSFEPCGEGEHLFVFIEKRNFDFGPKRHLRIGHREPVNQIEALAMKVLVGLDMHGHVQVSRWTPA